MPLTRGFYIVYNEPTLKGTAMQDEILALKVVAVFSVVTIMIITIALTIAGNIAEYDCRQTNSVEFCAQSRNW